MDKTPPPLSLSAALALPLPEGRRSAEILVDGDLELRLYAPKAHDPQTPHDRDELYIVATGHGKFRVGDRVDAFARARCSTSARTRPTASRISPTISPPGWCSTAR